MNGQGENSASQKFWDEKYAARTGQTTGIPSKLLVEYTQDRSSGRALELGCGRGDDAIWLAQQGWQVTAVDVSQIALDYAQNNAERLDVAEKIKFERHDLSQSLPTGEFDLVAALFLQSSVDFGREAALKAVSDMVAVGGLILVVTHGSLSPWSSAPADTIFPSPDEALNAIGLDMGMWQRVFVGNLERAATGPSGQKAKVLDTVLALQRT